MQAEVCRNKFAESLKSLPHPQTDGRLQNSSAGTGFAKTWRSTRHSMKNKGFQRC
jgi:hypothetical protein